jgi:hypothetical protein
MCAVVCLAGCTKPAALPDIIVSAASPGGFTRFRADLGVRFPADLLKDFDTAVQELQLDAMNRDVPTAAARELDMLAVVNGKPVHAVTLLGWQARKARFLREIAELDRMLQHDLELQARTAATGTPETVLTRIHSEQEVIAKLQRNLADTERRLAELGSAKP